MALTDDLRRFQEGGIAEKIGAGMNAVASMPRYAASAANDFVVNPVRESVSNFASGVARGAGYEGIGEARADTRGFMSPGSPHEGEDILPTDRGVGRALNDPASGNPVSPFIENAEKDAMRSTGPVKDFMTKTEGSYVNGREVSGEWGAPGSSGMPGPGGTVNTISAEAFMNPGGKDAGAAAVGRARRDFQLRQEGNAGLASDATDEEKRAWQKQQLMQDFQNLDLGADQSLSSLNHNKAKARMIKSQLEGFQTQAAAESEAQQKRLDRENKLAVERIKNQPGGSNLKVGGTLEAIRNKMVKNGFNSLSTEENYLLTQGIREQAVADLAKENYGEPVTQDQISKRVDLILGQLKQAASAAGEQGNNSADKLVDTGKNTSLPQGAMDALKKAGPGKGLRLKDGSVWTMDENGKAVKVQ